MFNHIYPDEFYSNKGNFCKRNMNYISRFINQMPEDVQTITIKKVVDSEGKPFKFPFENQPRPATTEKLTRQQRIALKNASKEERLKKFGAKEIETKEEINLFKYDTIRFLSDDKNKIFSFVLDNCYIKEMEVSQFTHTTRLICGYYNKVVKDEEGKIENNPNDTYNFFKRLDGFIIDWLSKNHKPVAEKRHINCLPNGKRKRNYHYFPLYVSSGAADLIGDLVGDEGNYTIQMSVIIIKHDNFYYPLMYLTDIYN